MRSLSKKCFLARSDTYKVATSRGNPSDVYRAVWLVLGNPTFEGGTSGPSNGFPINYNFHSLVKHIPN